MKKVKRFFKSLFKVFVFCVSVTIAFIIVSYMPQTNVEAVNADNDIYCCGLSEGDEETEYNVKTIEIDDNLPSAVDLSESNYFPPIGNQGSYGSCASWATTYYQFTYEVARLNNWDAKNDATKRFSPAFVFNYIYGIHDELNTEASSISNNYEVLKTIGAVRYTEFSQFYQYPWYQSDSVSNGIFTHEELYNAMETRISSINYVIVSSSSEGEPLITGPQDSDLSPMKQLLNNGYCLVVSVYDPNTFVYGVSTNNQKVAVAAKTSVGSHAMTIVGYDDTIQYVSPSGAIITGAFKLANSWGTDADNHNDGYMWLMYDAINETSVISALDDDDRESALNSNVFYYIEVANYEPQFTVEITVEQLYRNGFNLYLQRSTSLEATPVTCKTFVYELEQARAFDGSTNPTLNQSYTFVFDYDALKLYEGEGYYYWVEVSDLEMDDNKNTTVSKIVWKDENGNVLRQQTPNVILNGMTGRYCMILGSAELNKRSQRIQLGDTDTLTATIAPSDLTYSWQSSNTNCVTVTNGTVNAVGLGNAVVTVTATAPNGDTWTDSCSYTVVEGYGSSYDDATVVYLNDKKTGELAREGDESWFKFSPTETCKYVIYTTGSTDTYGIIYSDAETALRQSDNLSADDSNFCIVGNFSVNNTYRIKINSANNDTGEYSLCIAKFAVEYVSLSDINPDARHVTVISCAASVFDTSVLSIGSTSFTLQRGSTAVMETEINGTRIKVTFNDVQDVPLTEWKVELDVSNIDALVGAENTVSVVFNLGSVSTASKSANYALLAYDTSFVAGVDLDAQNSLQLLLAELEQDGYTLSVYDRNDVAVNVTSNTLACTGMKIVKRITSSSKIVEVFHVVVLGDVQSDGCVDSLDSSAILSYDAGTGSLVAISLIAADANQDGYVDNLDSALILKYDAGMVDIEQVLEQTDVPSGVYYGASVSF